MDSEERKWTLYIHTVPKGIRSSPDKDDYYDKYYIGITCRNVNQRWGCDGYEYKNQVFYNAIQKYGWENIRHEIIADNLTYKESCELERQYIKELKSTTEDGHGYNVTGGGE